MKNTLKKMTALVLSLIIALFALALGGCSCKGEPEDVPMLDGDAPVEEYTPNYNEEDDGFGSEMEM